MHLKSRENEKWLPKQKPTSTVNSQSTGKKELRKQRKKHPTSPDVKI